MSKFGVIWNLWIIIYLAFMAGRFPVPKQRKRALLYLGGAFLVAGLTTWKLWGSLT